jgi:hypothetical protein
VVGLLVPESQRQRITQRLQWQRVVDVGPEVGSSSKQPVQGTQGLPDDARLLLHRLGSQRQLRFTQLQVQEELKRSQPLD